MVIRRTITLTVAQWGMRCIWVARNRTWRMKVHFLSRYQYTSLLICYSSSDLFSSLNLNVDTLPGGTGYIDTAVPDINNFFMLPATNTSPEATIPFQSTAMHGMASAPQNSTFSESFNSASATSGQGTEQASGTSTSAGTRRKRKASIELTAPVEGSRIRHPPQPFPGMVPTVAKRDKPVSRGGGGGGIRRGRS